MTTRTITGRIVGALSARPASGATLSSDGDGMDFAIGGLGFRLAISDKNPYERATADFRKEQFDAAPTVGDQSLTGWWTRGQLSFHRGAGVKFYEVLDGETVLNRYSTASDVDPFTAGQVTLAPALDALTLTAVKDATYVAASTGDRVLVLKTGGTLHRIPVGAPWASQAVTALPTSNGDAAAAICSTTFRGYVAVKNRIEQYTPGGASATTVLWTNSDNNNFIGLWWAKDRLWAVDDAGRWFMLSTAGGTITNASAEFTIPELGTGVSSGDLWSLTESPGAVYIAAYSRVYAVTVDQQAATPTPSVPVVVAELPNDEIVRCVGFTSGALAIATSKGVRFGLTAASGEVQYGPLVSDADFNATVRVASKGSRVYLAGTSSEGSGLYAFDLSSLVEDMQPAYTFEHTLPGTLGYSGALSTPAGLVTWNSNDTSIYRTGASKTTSGVLTTGYHRFGTLEPKQFHSVKVRVGGDGGTVGISRVMADGTSVLLYTLNVTTASGQDVTLGLPEPVEMLALRFTLQRDATDPAKGPALFGYQLRALPAPRRQRLIRVPLMLLDVEARGSARALGREGEGWRRLSALEQMEESGGTHVFQDFRTGEAGQCYIEKVEHQGSTPPGDRDTGFGGVVFVTLRKIDG